LEATSKMVQAQVKAYEMEKGTLPTTQQLIEQKYILSDKCPNGNKIVINTNGEVSESDE